mgnify:CR=1 FL=1
MILNPIYIISIPTISLNPVVAVHSTNFSIILLIFILLKSNKKFFNPIKRNENQAFALQQKLF